MRLKNKRTIITAAASGMGKAGAELFSAEGARVAALDINEEQLEEVVADLQVGGGDVKGFVVDLSDDEATVRVVQEAIAWLGGLDVLWNHAGMPAPSDMETLHLDSYRKSADVNLTSSIQVSAEAIRAMRAEGSGSIVFTSSTSGLVGSALSPIYSALKAGIIGLTRGLAVRYASDGIRVNAVCPGAVATPMLYNDFMASDERFSKEENEQRVVAPVPMGRTARPKEVAHAALWLASDDASFITGISLPVDGGMTAK